MALTWDLLKSNLPAPIKKGTILAFDQVFGLHLDAWQPKEQEIPAEFLNMVKERQKARSEKRWNDADVIRNQIIAGGYEIFDTPQGTKLKRKRQE